MSQMPIKSSVRKYQIVIAILLLALVVSLVKMPTTSVPDDVYTIKKQNVTCAVVSPAQCTGNLRLISTGGGDIEATIDNNTKLRFIGSGTSGGLNELKEHTVAYVTFKPGNTTIDAIILGQ